jgi:hypothetical protein
VADAKQRNPLMLPLFAISSVALIEAVVIVVLLANRSPQPVPAVTLAPAPSTPNAPSAPPATAPAAPRGKNGERVESGGLAITAEKVLNEPQTYKDQVSIGAGERYIALLVRVDNETGGNAQLFPSQFVLKDDQGFTYDQLGVHGTMPTLEWRTLANRETVRGYVDFVLPKSAKGLTLVYGDTSQSKGGQPIQIEVDR